NNPKILTNCGHSICNNCINAIFYNDNTMKCPICNTITQTTQNKLLVNYSLISAIEILQSIQNRDCILNEEFEKIDPSLDNIDEILSNDSRPEGSRPEGLQDKTFIPENSMCCCFSSARRYKDFE
ncbi:MAG: hypothetical protein ACW98X_22465, partial [Promethearchaeota archaeon]